MQTCAQCGLDVPQRHDVVPLYCPHCGHYLPAAVDVTARLPRRERPRPLPRVQVGGRSNMAAVASLILGVFSIAPICTGVLLGPAAIIEGVRALRNAAHAPRPRGLALAIAGIVLGCFGSVIGAAWLLYWGSRSRILD